MLQRLRRSSPTSCCTYRRPCAGLSCPSIASGRRFSASCWRSGFAFLRHVRLCPSAVRTRCGTKRCSCVSVLCAGGRRGLISPAV
eukprot:4297630-Lingulodinium_polyedra.AAC.1